MDSMVLMDGREPISILIALAKVRIARTLGLSTTHFVQEAVGKVLIQCDGKPPCGRAD
jgi:hypothetical protein